MIMMKQKGKTTFYIKCYNNCKHSNYFINIIGTNLYAYLSVRDTQ